MSMVAITRTTPWTNGSDSWSFLLPSADLASLPRFLQYDGPTFLGLLTPDSWGHSADLNSPKVNAMMVAIIQVSLVGGGMSNSAAQANALRIVNYGSAALPGARAIVIDILTAAIAAG